MLAFNSNTNNKIVKVFDKHIYKFGLASLLVISLITSGLLWFYITDNRNSQESPVNTEYFTSKLQPSYWDTPDTFIFNSTKNPTPVGKLTNYLKPINFTLSAADSDGDPLVYSASNLPDGASFDPDTRTFSWTPRYDQAGTYVVRFEVSDGQLTDTEDVIITVVQPSDDWDINGDGDANVLDMVMVGQHWDETGQTGWIREDTNEDGNINILDIILIGQHWTE